MWIARPVYRARPNRLEADLPSNGLALQSPVLAGDLVATEEVVADRVPGRAGIAASRGL